MADLLQSGASWLQGMRHAHMSHLVKYYRGGVGNPAIELNATRGKSTLEQRDQSEVISVVETRDFTFRRSDLAVAGIPFEPAEKDRIREFIGGKMQTYAPVRAAGDHCFRFEDEGREAIRVHTVLVGEETL